ncbi:DUF4855 domain-containing protein [Candidatus Sumerlaeota bacterium]|nr:DUF4855 domain-containing protein [Candidatus Sumerlaeota bacterium]
MYLEPGRKDLGGLRHLVFLGESTSFSEDLKTYLVEFNQKGKPKRWLFDSFVLYLKTSSGNALSADINIGDAMCGEGNFYAVPSPNPGTIKDWMETIETYYSKDGMLDILNGEVEKFAGKLGKPEHPINVVLVMNYPLPNQSRFGVVNGKNLNFSVLGQNLDKASRQRLEACQFHANELKKNWNKKRFPNLNLLGFYWPFETVYRSWDMDDHWVLKELKTHVNKMGLKMFWIPFWCSWNAHLLDDYENYYFDAAFLQPNYMFYEDIKGVKEAAKDAKKRHAGIEMEFYRDVPGLPFRKKVIQERLKRFRAYLDGGVKYGYMKDSANAWFLGADILPHLCRSNKKEDRELYKDICAFIHAEYERKNDMSRRSHAFGVTKTEG